MLRACGFSVKMSNTQDKNGPMPPNTPPYQDPRKILARKINDAQCGMGSIESQPFGTGP